MNKITTTIEKQKLFLQTKEGLVNKKELYYSDQNLLTFYDENIRKSIFTAKDDQKSCFLLVSYSSSESEPVDYEEILTLNDGLEIFDKYGKFRFKKIANITRDFLNRRNRFDLAEHPDNTCDYKHAEKMIAYWKEDCSKDGWDRVEFYPAINDEKECFLEKRFWMYSDAMRAGCEDETFISLKDGIKTLLEKEFWNIFDYFESEK